VRKTLQGRGESKQFPTKEIIRGLVTADESKRTQYRLFLACLLGYDPNIIDMIVSQSVIANGSRKNSCGHKTLRVEALFVIVAILTNRIYPYYDGKNYTFSVAAPFSHFVEILVYSGLLTGIELCDLPTISHKKNMGKYAYGKIYLSLAKNENDMLMFVISVSPGEPLIPFPAEQGDVESQACAPVPSPKKGKRKMGGQIARMTSLACPVRSVSMDSSRTGSGQSPVDSTGEESPVSSGPDPDTSAGSKRTFAEVALSGVPIDSQSADSVRRRRVHVANSDGDQAPVHFIQTFSNLDQLNGQILQAVPYTGNERYRSATAITQVSPSSEALLNAIVFSPSSEEIFSDLRWGSGNSDQGNACPPSVGVPVQANTSPCKGKNKNNSPKVHKSRQVLPAKSASPVVDYGKYRAHLLDGNKDNIPWEFKFYLEEIKRAVTVFPVGGDSHEYMQKDYGAPGSFSFMSEIDKIRHLLRDFLSAKQKFFGRINGICDILLREICSTEITSNPTGSENEFLHAVFDYLWSEFLIEHTGKNADCIEVGERLRKRMSAYVRSYKLKTGGIQKDGDVKGGVDLHIFASLLLPTMGPW